MPQLDIYTLAIISLATFRIAYFVTREDAPFGIMARIRDKYPLGGLLTCFYCFSVWVAVPVYLASQTVLYGMLEALAVMAIAVIIYRYCGFDL
jgi:hypothetical protein